LPEWQQWEVSLHIYRSNLKVAFPFQPDVSLKAGVDFQEPAITEGDASCTRGEEISAIGAIS
jgi:hypothetical protein